MTRLRDIAIVEDRTATSRCDEGFLTLRRLQLRNEYDDGSHSETYPCDLVCRQGSDAVVAVLYELVDELVGELVDESGASRAGKPGKRQLRVLLRDGIRAPVFLRKHKEFVNPDPRVYRSVGELVAGMVEPDDGPGPAGLAHRAAAESDEEAGLNIPAAEFSMLGGETFASPGTGDEKLFYCAAQASLAEAKPGLGDGSIMEEGANVRVLEIREAITACRTGDVPDMKTELGLLRLAEHLGYIPQLDCFVDELPADWAQRYQRLGIDPRENAAS
ncbi:MAG: ADP-ribose pyrophosphatase [Pseudohongiellaceae bacterium]|jgi:ADP-ribose pyrophosphatase